MRVFVLLSLVAVALAATKCDAKRTADKAVSRNNARVAKSTRGGSRRKGSSRDKGQGSSGGTSVAERTLLSELVQTNSERTGLNASNPAQFCRPLTVQVASLTDKANFINFCKGKTITNGLQVKEGSCNGIVMGQIPAVDKMVSAKFQFPKNTQTGIKAFQDFKVLLKINNLETGHFTNPNTNYYAAPQQLNKDGIPIGHTHIVINQIKSFDDTDLADPVKFAFFKGIDPPGVDGISSVVVTGGLPAATYRMCSINTAANHQPLLMPVAQHNSNDDCIYFKTNRRRAQAAHRLAAQSADLE